MIIIAVYFQADMLHLKQRLADSRQVGVHLEIQLSQLKTDNAKLSGSYQALLTIREQLSVENARFRSSYKELQSEKEEWLRDKEILLSDIDNLSNEALGLSNELTKVKVCFHMR